MQGDLFGHKRDTKKARAKRKSDRDRGRRLRDSAVSAVAEHANERFMAQAITAVHAAARVYETLIIDDVWAMFSEWPDTHDHRAMGPVMLIAKRSLWIEPTGEFKPTAQTQCHASPRRIWRSLIYQGATKAATA